MSLLTMLYKGMDLTSRKNDERFSGVSMSNLLPVVIRQIRPTMLVKILTGK